MNGKPDNKNRIEVSSDPLKAELVAIKDRLSAIETIEAIANRAVVEEYVRTHLSSAKAKLIMKECEEPQTRDYLKTKLNFASAQALDYHLNPLREDDLLRLHSDDDGVQTFMWSNLFKRLPRKKIDELLNA